MPQRQQGPSANTGQTVRARADINQQCEATRPGAGTQKFPSGASRLTVEERYGGATRTQSSLH
jgi:hypothetical protein